MLTLGQLHERDAVQRAIWLPTQHLLSDRRKPRKTLIELASRRTFRMRTDFLPEVRHLNTRHYLKMSFALKPAFAQHNLSG
jgi:hypothetical protein